MKSGLVLLALLLSGCFEQRPAEVPPRQVPAIGEPKQQGERLPGEQKARQGLLDAPLCADGSAYCERCGEAETLLKNGRPSGLREELEALIEAEPSRFEAWVLSGRLKRAQESLAFGEGGEGSRASLAAFERARELSPDEDVVLLELVRTWLSLGRSEEARTLLTLLSQRHPSDPEVAGALGVASLAEGKTAEARRWFSRAVELDPKSAERWSALGTLRLLEGQLDGAEASFRQAIALDSSLPKAHGDLGALLLLRGRLDEGLAHLERALTLKPRQATYLSNLAYGRHLKGRPDALETARAAVRADEKLVSARLTLALILAAAGELDEAALEIERAARLAPDDPRVQTAREDLEELRVTRR